jgi:hypothetical protein
LTLRSGKNCERMGNMDEFKIPNAANHHKKAFLTFYDVSKH